MRTVTEIDAMFMAAGFILVRQDKHRIWRCPCGHIQLTSQSSPCKGRGDQNVKAKMRRALRGCKPQAGGKAA
jgi:hypothetical protein